ncbi:hypothetical protein BABINDRAFT_83496 [Babjeviella inositovora NRRL Y-12698]|uniref:SHSP domain-containing protein n=1 Tax=Babjeviella inositovora NRRL Y-12698 TaxID=984486 RepID=A0A1E3QLB5_9ASCO|nr:uncharacterized protein BABINDRAFT_83496 [Babjeviella inositovora NRRL Y-12698]ODQ78408.1 hypothetical protein BABINDRAFT_83496 [Babjeviella inositovora NRRL Y-12698]
MFSFLSIPHGESHDNPYGNTWANSNPKCNKANPTFSDGHPFLDQGSVLLYSLFSPTSISPEYSHASQTSSYTLNHHPKNSGRARHSKKQTQCKSPVLSTDVSNHSLRLTLTVPGRKVKLNHCELCIRQDSHDPTKSKLSIKSKKYKFKKHVRVDSAKFDMADAHTVVKNGILVISIPTRHTEANPKTAAEAVAIATEGSSEVSNAIHDPGCFDSCASYTLDISEDFMDGGSAPSSVSSSPTLPEWELGKISKEPTLEEIEDAEFTRLRLAV